MSSFQHMRVDTFTFPFTPDEEPMLTHAVAVFQNKSFHHVEFQVRNPAFHDSVSIAARCDEIRPIFENMVEGLKANL